MPATDPKRVALNERAIESLEFIRTTMARSAPFTAVPGYGGIVIGVVGLAGQRRYEALRKSPPCDAPERVAMR
jgi:hypothetical protein